MLKHFISAAGLTALLVGEALACDPCALYSASRLQGHESGAVTLSVSEQYTDYDRPREFRENSVRSGEFVRGFSTTQFALSYDPSETFGLQLTVPLVARSFDEVRSFRTESGSDAGIGDLSLVGSYSFLNNLTGDWRFLAGAFGGVKFPTGDTGVLREVSEDSADVTPEAFLRHHTIGSASGGRALAFGSGSYDYITGVNFLTRYDRTLLLGTAQYTIRTEGDFGYEFADDFLWTASAGQYLALGHDYSWALLASLSGEFKGKDDLNGELVAGSDTSNLYLGPTTFFTYGEALGAEITIDFRVTGEDPGASVVPDMRVRAALSYRFL